MIQPGTPMSASELRGVVPALITPLDERAEVDEGSIHSLIEFQISSGVHGVFVLGSTGEGPLLSTDQKVSVVRATVEATAGRVPVMVGIGSSSPAESAAFGRLAADAGANALVACAPFYFTHSQAEVLAAFRLVAQRVDLPLIAYDVPSAVKVKLTTSTVRVLAEEGLVIGIKDSSGDLAGFRDLVLATAGLPDFHALTGSEPYLDAAMLVGGDGGVVGLGSLIPETFVDIYEAAVRGDWQRANTLQQHAIATLRMIFVGQGYGSLSATAIGSFKVALREMGVIRSTTLAAPLQPLTEGEVQAVLDITRRLELGRGVGARV